MKLKKLVARNILYRNIESAGIQNLELISDLGNFPIFTYF